MNFSHSKILQCKFFPDDEEPYEFPKLKYKSILKHVYEDLIADGIKIIKNSLLNIKTKFKNTNGYDYYEELGISVKGVCNKNRLEEIINQCLENNFKVYLKIKLKMMK